jgi:hypothetical protein
VAAAAKGDDRTVAEVRAEFGHLLHPVPSTWAAGPELARMPAVLLDLVNEYLVLTPLEQARASQASASLERHLAQRSSGVPSGKASSSSSGASSSSVPGPVAAPGEGATEGKQEAPPAASANRKRGPGDREESDRGPKQRREAPEVTSGN